MSIITAVMDGIANATFVIGTMITNAAIALRDFVGRFANSSDSESDVCSRREIFDRVKSYNDEFEDYDRKFRRDGILNEKDRDRMLEIKKGRDCVFHKFEIAQQNDIAGEIVQQPGSFDTFRLDRNHAHILQYHIGLTVFNIKCHICERPMVLQFPKDRDVITPEDFFWACSGFYGGNCRATRKISLIDMQNLFARTDIPEFHSTADDLNDIFDYSSVKRNVLARVKNHLNDECDDYICPIHKEPLVLKEKKRFFGSLDQFFLGCPRWKADRTGCSFVMKLKSPAQLAALLRNKEDRGIL